MTTARQREQAIRFRALHRPGTPLVLANAWDVASARVFALAGAPALGTTSAGVAWSLGFPDGQQLPVPLLVEASARIARAIDVPLTVDVEAGWGDGPGAVREVVRAVVEAGAVGVNVEDGSAAPEVLVEKIGALRELAGSLDLPLFVNARTDLYLRPLVAADERLPEAERRLGRYAAAGADGLFVPGIADPEEIARLARTLPRPLNVYAFRGVPPVRELARLGVGRVSVGCGPMQATLGLARRIAVELFEGGTYEHMAEGALSVGEANHLFVRD
jgi:2-methylisocitrate lyase-like PEP mutase family enzyme